MSSQTWRRRRTVGFDPTHLLRRRPRDLRRSLPAQKAAEKGGGPDGSRARSHRGTKPHGETAWVTGTGNARASRSARQERGVRPGSARARRRQATRVVPRGTGTGGVPAGMTGAMTALRPPGATTAGAAGDLFFPFSFALFGNVLPTVTS